MRSLILVVITAFLLATGGLVYFWMQPSGRRNPAGKTFATSGPVRLEPNETGGQIGSGDDVAVKKYDQRTGELISEFMASKYKPLKGGKIAVENATATFYLSDHQKLLIHGVTGVFNGDNTASAPKKGMASSQVQTPTRGRMKDVTLTIVDRDGQTAMTIAMNNAAFDSENSTVYTESYTDPATAAEVPADQVKVTIRSPESNPAGYDFDGRGLRLAWNERDRRLAKLDVAHGESLVVRNPKGLARTKPEAATQPATAVSPSPKPVTTGATGIAASPTKPGTGGATPFPPNTDPPIYRALFLNQVRIVQNGQPLAAADRMSVDFWMKSGGDPAKPATGPATAPSATLPAEQAPANHPTTSPTVATTRPASRPADEAPVTIYWTGPLHVEPYPQGAATALDSIVTFDGAPVVAKQQTSEIRAARLVYHTEEGSVRATTIPGQTVTMTTADAHGNSVITTAMLEYFAKTQPPRAILTGRSTADLPAQADGTKMKAAWVDRAILQFQTDAEGRSAIRDADITGSVSIDHPQLKLNSNRLEMAFDVSERSAPAKPAPATQSTAQSTTPPSGMMQANLKRLVASEAVHCEMKDSSNKTETIDSNSLTLLTDHSPDGRLVPRTVNADGSVHAVDADQDLHAGHLAITLVPSTRPASTRPATQTASTQPAGGFGGNVDLQSLIANDSVHVLGKKDGTEVFASTMLVDKRDGKTAVKFLGQPSARIIQKNNIITGPVIDISPDGQILAVDGAGTMHGQQQESAGATTKPVDVTWSRNMKIDGRRNIVDAVGEVVANTMDADGTLNTVRGDRARLLLVDVPTTQPATKPAERVAATQPTSQPATREAVAKKNIRQAVFQEHASVSSTLLDNDGNPLRRMNLFSDWIQYDVLPSPAGPAAGLMKKMTVPGPGKMLVEDYRAPSTQPAAGGGDMTGSRGATAFQWVKGLTYDDATHKAVIQGTVVIDHRDDVQKDDSLRLTGDVVTAELEPVAAMKPATMPATQGAGKPATQPTEAKFQVRRIVAQGNLLVTLHGGQLQCDSIVYDPVTRLLTARGNDKIDAIFVRNGSAAVMRAEEMQWDANAELPRIIKGRGSFRR